jgi:hypothetical protein
MVANIPNFEGPDKPQDDIVLKPVRIVHTNGQIETAYVQDLTQQSEIHTTHHHVHKHLVIIYLTVGTLALALSAYATMKMLKKK